MGRVVATFVLLLSATALAGCLDGASFSVTTPEWRPGYTWSFETGWENRFESVQNGIKSNDTSDGEGHTVLRILNTTTAVAGVPVHLGVVEEDGQREMVAYRRGDLAPLDLDLDTMRTCGAGKCITVVREMRIEEEAPVWLDFPLKRGKTWGHKEVDDSAGLDVEFVFSARVQGQTTVETPMGPVKAVHIVKTVRVTNLDEVLGVLRAMLEADGVEVDELQADARVEAHEYYSAKHQMSVVYEETEISSYKLRGRVGGEPFEESQSATTRSWQHVSGAALVATPGLPLQDIGLALGADVPIVDPSGDIVVPPPYTVGIQVLQGTANGAEPQPLSYRATVEGEMPPDHKLRWRALDWGSSVVLEGNGQAFGASLPVGSYRVQLLATDGDGVLVASAQAPGLVHHTQAVEVDCGLLEFFGNTQLGDCEAQELPIHPGVDSVLVLAASTSLADAVNIGRLELRDAGGMVAASAAELIQMNDFRGTQLDSDPWMLDYVRQLGVMEAIRLDIDIRYAALPGEPPAPEPQSIPGGGCNPSCLRIGDPWTQPNLLVEVLPMERR